MHLFHPYDAYFEEHIQDRTRRTPNWFLYIAKYVIRPASHLLYRMEVRGRENIPAPGEEPVVFVANHVSYADPVVLWCSTPPRIIRFLARSSLWRIPVFRGIISRAAAIPVDPDSADRKAIKRAVAALKRGECIGVFAEGTRMKSSDKVFNPHAGFVLIAQMGCAKVVPVGITGTDRIAPPNKRLWRLPKVTVTFGTAIDLTSFSDLPKGERTQAIVDETMRRVFALRDAADTCPIRPGLPPYGTIPRELEERLLRAQEPTGKPEQGAVREPDGKREA